jgi:hypothetical protein
MGQLQQVTAEQLAHQVKLQKLAAFARSHGNEARVVGDVVEVDFEAHNIHTQAWTVETETASTMSEMRDILGY